MTLDWWVQGTDDWSMSTSPSTETLIAVLGVQVFTFGFPTLDAANAHAALRMAQGRPAVTYVDAEGVAVCSYGVKS